MEIYLKTDRLILRQFEQKDSAFLADLDSDPEVMRFLTDGVPSDSFEIRRATGAMTRPGLSLDIVLNANFGARVTGARQVGP